jgi:hypothetical protein
MIALKKSNIQHRRPFGAILRGCFLFSVLLWATQEATAHPFHVSFAEVDWNATAGTLEVALKIDPDDLEREVRLHCGRRISLEEKEAAPLVAAYVRDHFSIGSAATNNERHAANFRWIGSETTLKSAWLFFEIKSKENPAGLFIQNRLLAHTEQPTNTVLVRADKSSSTMTFGHQQTRQAIVLEPIPSE